MDMTITQKILADHAGLEEVHPGQLINANVDIALGNDITAPITIEQFKKAGAKKVFDKKKVVLIPDHEGVCPGTGAYPLLRSRSGWDRARTSSRAGNRRAR